MYYTAHLVSVSERFYFFSSLCTSYIVFMTVEQRLRVAVCAQKGNPPPLL